MIINHIYSPKLNSRKMYVIEKFIDFYSVSMTHFEVTDDIRMKTSYNYPLF